VPEAFYGYRIPGASPRDIWPNTMQAVRRGEVALQRGADEMVGEAPCMVLSAQTAQGRITVWIGRVDGLVHRSRQSVLQPSESYTDQKISQLLGETRPAEIERIRGLLQDGQAKVGREGRAVEVRITWADRPHEVTVTLPGPTVYVQTHRQISTDDRLAPSDFERTKQ
jgi:hypothetical protein